MDLHIPLPNPIAPPNTWGIQPPRTTPSIPPNNEDLVSAKVYQEKVYAGFLAKVVNMDDTAQALRYNSRVLAYANSLLPAPYADFAAALAPMKAQLDRLMDRMDQSEARFNARLDQTGAQLDRLRDRMDQSEARLSARLDQTEAQLNTRLDQMVGQLGNINILVASNYNRSHGDQGFHVVPFRDGTLPTVAPHNLPALDSVATIQNLTLQQYQAYFAGYYPGTQPPQEIAGMVAGILSAIGFLEI